VRDSVSLSALSRCSRSALYVANTVDVVVPASPVRRRCSSKLPKRDDHVLGSLRPTRHVLMKTGLSQQGRATAITVTWHLLVWLDRAPSNYFLVGGVFPPLAFLFFPRFPFVFEGLSNHVLFGGRLKIVGRSPAQPPSHFKMSSDYAIQVR
jgi:hypothetical protein